MSDYPDYSVQVTIDPTTELPVVQSDPTALKVEIYQPAAAENFKVIQATAANLKATVTQAAKDRTVTCDTAANLKVEIHQPAAAEDFKVIQATAANLKATVTQAAKDRTVTCDTAANLKSEVTPAAAAEFLNFPRIPTGATQVVAFNQASNNTAVIYTVTAGKTLYLVSLSMSTDPIQAGRGAITVRNASDVDQYYFFFANSPIAQGQAASMSFPIPYEIPEDWDIAVSSTVAACYVNGFIFGYEI